MTLDPAELGEDSVGWPSLVGEGKVPYISLATCHFGVAPGSGGDIDPENMDHEVDHCFALWI